MSAQPMPDGTNEVQQQTTKRRQVRFTTNQRRMTREKEAT
jgi:hypothetical protein